MALDRARGGQAGPAVLVPRGDRLVAPPTVVGLLRDASVPVVLHEAASGPLADLPVPGRGEIVIVVGPEGGISDEELAAFAAVGAEPVRLGYLGPAHLDGGRGGHRRAAGPHPLAVAPARPRRSGRARRSRHVVGGQLEAGDVGVGADPVGAWRDFGMTTMPCCRCQRMITCAGVRPSRSAISTMTGWSSVPPRRAL